MVLTLFYLLSVGLLCGPWVNCLEPEVCFLAGVINDQAHPGKKVPFDINRCQNVVLPFLHLLELRDDDFIEGLLEAEIDVDAEEGSNGAENYECWRLKPIEDGCECD